MALTKIVNIEIEYQWYKKYDVKVTTKTYSKNVRYVMKAKYQFTEHYEKVYLQINKNKVDENALTILTEFLKAFDKDLVLDKDKFVNNAIEKVWRNVTDKEMEMYSETINNIADSYANLVLIADDVFEFLNAMRLWLDILVTVPTEFTIICKFIQYPFADNGEVELIVTE